MVIAGITLSSMHQSSLGSLYVVAIHRLHPLWYSMLQPEFFLVSSIAAGISTIIIGSYISIKLFGHTLSESILERLGRIIPWILGVYLLLKIGDLILFGKVPLLLSSSILGILYLAEFLLMLVGLIWFSIKKLRSKRVSSLTGALIAAGIVLNRFDITWFAIKPLNGITYFPSWLEVALLVGVASGVLMLFTLMAHFFPIFSETMSSESLIDINTVTSQTIEATAAD